MAFGGPNLARGDASRAKGSPIHLLRLLRYSAADRRYLLPAIICVILVALTYSINIVALLPIIHVIQSEQGVPAWAHGWVAGERLGVEADELGVIVVVHGKAVVSDAINKGDVLIGLDGAERSPSEIYRAVARAPDGQALRLRLSRPGASAPIELIVTPRPDKWSYRAALRAADLLPREMGYDARMTTLILIVIGMLTIAIVGAVCRFLGEYLIALVSARTVVGMRRAMYRKVLRFPLHEFTRTSDLISRFVQDSQEIYRGLNFVFAKSLREPLKAAFSFTAALVLEPRVTIVAVITAPIAGLLIRQLGKTIRKSNRRLLLGYSRMLEALEGALTGIRVVKGYTMEGFERRRLFALDLHMLRQELKIARIEALTSPAFETIGRIVACGVLIYFAQLMFTKRMEFSEFATLTALMAAMFDPIRQMSGFYNRMQRANAAADRCFEVLDRAAEEPHDAALPALPPFRESIEFRDVRFTYPATDRPALDGISLRVLRGERVAVVGPNGSGKTTLLSVLMRFCEPQAGALLIDGRDVRAHSIASVRRQVSLVTQDTVIFPDTIAMNIAYGDEGILGRMTLRRRRPNRVPEKAAAADAERIIATARAAFADGFIREKPDGYDTILGEHGTTLSGGQKQRIAIARAMLRDAPIFVFDEATSQVDSESEKLIHEAVERFLQGRTAFIIAHRFSTIMQADRIVVMDRGRIVDVGGHHELLARCALYQSLYGTQIIDDRAPPARRGPALDELTALETGAPRPA